MNDSVTSELQVTHHSGVSEGVGLHSFKIKKLCDTFVVRAQEFGVDLGSHPRGLPDRLETGGRKELNGKGQAEKSLDSELASTPNDLIEQHPPDAQSAGARIDGYGPNFGQVLPQDVESRAPDDLPVLIFGHDELRDVLK